MTGIDTRRQSRGLARLKLLGLLAGVLLLGLIWAQRNPPSTGGQQAADRTGAPSKPASGTQQAASAASAGIASVSDAVAKMSSASDTGAAPRGRAPTGIEIATLGLTRQLSGDHLLTMDGRRQRVLGSKDVVDQAGRSDTMLVIRDEISGQLNYRRSGLQFTLKPGVDYESFIAEHRGMRRVFVNPLYAQVMVDAAEIADQFSALSRDDRIAKLRFLTRDPVVKPK